MGKIVYFLLPIAAYLIGSISSAVWIARTFYGINIREHGSGNAGATNTLRVLGPKAALPVFVIDFCKGVLAVLLVHLTPMIYQNEPNQYNGYEIILGISAVCGHIFPVFASFKGGKGVATIAGVITAICPGPMLLTFAVFLAIFIITRYVSLGSIFAAISFPIFVIVLFGMILRPENTTLTLKIFSVLASAMILITHRKNIRRLLDGTETKTTFKKKEPPKNEK